MSGDWQREEMEADQTRTNQQRGGQQLVQGEHCSLILVLEDVRDQPSRWKREGNECQPPSRDKEKGQRETEKNQKMKRQSIVNCTNTYLKVTSIDEY